MAQTTRLYTPQTIICGESIQLEKKTSHHLINVLRINILGTQVVVFNGDGYDHTATLVSNAPKGATLSIDDSLFITNESPINIILLQGLSRGDRMDTTLQKSVELGVNSIMPVICERSNYSIKPDRINKKIEHWQHIIISACEQSGRATLPQLTDIQPFDQAITLNRNCDRIILSPDAKHSLGNLDSPKNNNVCILVGPEGGLTDKEMDLARENAYQEIKFGPRTLRTETAGPAVISAIQTLWGDS